MERHKEITTNMRKRLKTIQAHMRGGCLTPELLKVISNDLWDDVGELERLLDSVSIEPDEPEFEVTVAGIHYAGSMAEQARQARRFKVIEGGLAHV